MTELRIRWTLGRITGDIKRRFVKQRKQLILQCSAINPNRKKENTSNNSR